jgi:subtilisin family serine protease
LAKTEDLRSETPIEEDNFVRAIEWGEQRGAQILTASLGYTKWYTRNDYNGIKGVTTKAINIAIQKGMICCIANGNDGVSGIGVPADSFYGISVGAVDLNGNIGGFSSHGPTADGRIKPEISALGVSNNIIDVLTIDGFSTGSGTSYATPIVAGAIALMLNVNPNLTVYQIYHAIISTGSLSTNPNNQYGYGVMDIEKALNFSNFPQSVTCDLNCGANGVCFKQSCLCFDQQDCGRNKCKIFSIF